MAILRGVLLDIGTLAELRHLSTRSVAALFEGAPPDLGAVAGVSAIAFSRRDVAYALVPPRARKNSVEFELRIGAEAACTDVPASAIAEVRDDEVHLRLTRDEVAAFARRAT